MAMNTAKRLHGRIEQRWEQKAVKARELREAAKAKEARADFDLVAQGKATMDWFRLRQYERWPSLRPKQRKEHK